MFPIVVLQTASTGFKVVREELRRAELPNQSYIIVDGVRSAEAEIVPGEFQFLVMGTIYGDIDQAEDFARDMRVKNRSLVVAGFSSIVDSFCIEVFHFCIVREFDHKKGNICNNLLKAMRDFLALRE